MKIIAVAAIFSSFLLGTVYGQTFELKQFVGPGSTYYTKYDWVDFNSDGAYDILEVDYYGNIALHIANGSSYNSTDFKFEGIYLGDGAQAFGDYDGDGDIDILVTKGYTIAILEYDETAGFSIVTTGITFTSVDGGAIFWIDIDGDQILDIIVGRKIYINNDGVYTGVSDLLPEYLTNMVLEDINSDGLPDIITGEYESYDGTTINIFLNKGEGHFSLSPIALPLSSLLSKTLTLLDADGDTDIDIFAIDRYQRGWIFKNNFAQSGELNYSSVQIFSNKSMFTAMAADINADGKEDIVAAGMTELTVLKNTSTESAISFTAETYTSNLQTFHSLDVVDINGDNKLDIHAKGHSSENGIENLYFENIGAAAGSAPLMPANLAAVVESNITLSWDAVPGLLYNVELKRNGNTYKPSGTSASGNLLFPSTSLLLRTGSQILYGLPAGDYEWHVQALDPARRSSPFSLTNTFTINAGPTNLTLNATDLNVVMLCWTYAGPGTPSYRIFRGTSNAPAVEIAVVPSGTTCFEDNSVPQNQVVYYFLVATNGTVDSAPSNTATHYSTIFVQTSFGTLKPNIINAICFPADYDNDGDYDLEFIGRVGSSDNNYFLKNNGDGTFDPVGPLLNAEGFANSYLDNVGPRDIDNDGDLDLILIQSPSYGIQQLAVFINNNGAFTLGFETPLYRYISQFAVEDFNNDGKLDLLYSYSYDNADNRYQLLHQTEDGNFVDSHWVFTESQSSNMDFFKCADINKDGFMDIIWSSSGSNTADILINEEGTSFVKKSSILSSDYFKGIEDYNGDGYIDVVVVGNEGLNLYFGTEDHSFTEPKVIPIEFLSNSPQFINADIDLDGWTDLILSDGIYSYVILNTGKGSFRSSDIKLERNPGASVAITDFENDGDIDLVKMGNDYQHQGLNYFYRNQLADVNRINQPPVAPEGLSAVYRDGISIFSWLPSTDDNTPQALISYNLKITDNNGKTWLSGETNESGNFKLSLTSGNMNHATRKIMNYLPAGTYTAQIQAVDAAFRLSSWSVQTQLTIQEGPSALTIERILLNKVGLSWNNSSFNETNVVVQRRTVQTNWEVIAELPAGSSTYTDAGLQYNTLYQYRVFEASETQTTSISNIVEWNTNMWVLEDTEIPNLWGYMDVADFTGDGRMDLVLNGGMIYNGYTEDLTRATFENTATGWVKSDLSQDALTHTAKIAFTDLNGDAKPDIYLNGYAWDFGYKTETLLNNGDKTFTPATNFLTEGTYSIIANFDFDMDNDIDLVVARTGTNTRELLENRGGGSYNSVETITCYSCPYDAAVADFDQDGDEDIVRYVGGSYKLYLNTPAGLAGTNVSFPGYDSRIFTQDYNSDGLPDIVLLTYSSYSNGKIFKNLGLQSDGSMKFLELPINFSNGEQSLLSADFDHDGRTDLVVTSPAINVLLGNGDDTFRKYIEPEFRWGQHMAGLIDFDNDGDLDIYISGYHNKNNELTDRKAKILLNQTIVASNGIKNAPPEPPVGLSNTQDSNGVHLTWDAPIDDHTPSGGITYDVVLFRDGKSITKGDHDPATGHRLRLTPGRSTGIATINNLPIGEYSWKVQAVDGSFAASDFSEEGTFVFLPPPPDITDTLIYKCGRTITLSAQGDIKWYRDEALTQLIASGVFHPEETQIVYVVQTVDGYRGVPKRVQITIEEKSPPPTFMQSNPVTLCQSNGQYTLWASGENIRWYSDESLVGLLSTTATVEVSASNATYYVTQTIDGCQSNALAIQVKMIAIDSRLYYSDGNIWSRETEGEFFYWYRNGFFFRATNVPYIPFDGEPATYVVSVRKGQCQVYSEPFVLTPIQEQMETMLTISPNPSSSYITLRSKYVNSKISILNSLGKVIYSTTMNHEEKMIDTSTWVKGVYLVTIDDGKTVYTKRLVLL